jgi:hypothetical protein
MGMQDMISNMEIFPICIQLVTESSPYAYGDSTNPRMRMGIRVLAIPVCIQGLWSLSNSIQEHNGDDFDVRMQKV